MKDAIYQKCLTQHNKTPAMGYANCIGLLSLCSPTKSCTDESAAKTTIPSNCLYNLSLVCENGHWKQVLLGLIFQTIAVSFLLLVRSDLSIPLQQARLSDFYSSSQVWLKVLLISKIKQFNLDPLNCNFAYENGMGFFIFRLFLWFVINYRNDEISKTVYYWENSSELLRISSNRH